jgi:hypothetical protein
MICDPQLKTDAWTRKQEDSRRKGNAREYVTNDEMALKQLQVDL